MEAVCSLEVESEDEGQIFITQVSKILDDCPSQTAQLPDFTSSFVDFPSQQNDISSDEDIDQM